jgi:hypothetical protein
MAKETLNLEVKSNIKSVTEDTDDLGKSISKASDETTGLGTGLATTGTAGSKGFKAISSAVYGLGLALKAIGIGIIIGLFASLKESLERNQTVMNAVNTIMTTISTTFNQVGDVLIKVVSWVTESSERFDGLTKVISGLMTIGLVPLKLAFYTIKLAVEGLMLAWEDSFLGGGDEKRIAELSASIRGTANDIKEVGLAAIEAGKDIGKNIGDAIGEIGAIGKMAIDGISEISIKSNFELAKATTAAANSSKLAEAAIQGLIEKYDRQAELQRQIRDDETKTFAERIEANKKLGEILDEQETKMLALADTRVASAALELSANKENIELQVAFQQALNDRAGVEAQVAGFRSEQMTNEVSLNKELGEIKKEVLNASLEGVALELQELKNSYEMQIEMARKAGMDTTAITEKYEKDKANIIKDNSKQILKFAEMSSEAQLDIASTTAGNLSKILGEETAAGKAMAIIQATIDTYKGATSAYASMAGIPIVGPVLGGIAAGAAIIAGLANVKAIAGTGGGGGGPGPSAAPPPQTPAPQMMSGAFELTGGQEVEPARAYVVSDDITESQNGLAIIRRRATI